MTGSRWRIAFVVSVAIAVSYLDRQSLPVAVAAIQKDIPLTNTAFGALTSMFLLSYALMYAGGGALIDRLGTRRGFLVIMVFWSIACASHAFATGFWMLAASRFLLGAGEGGGFPAATKVVAERFAPAQRSTAMGIINAGTAVGAVIAPPAIGAIIAFGSWRWTFVVFGAAGLLWAAWWSLEASAGDNPAAAQPDSDETSRTPYASLLADHRVRVLVFAKFLTDAAWFFYISWLPKYLYDARGFDVKHVAYFAWLPFAASGVGSLVGGWFSSRLLASGRSVDFSRKLALGLSAAVMPAIIFVTRVPVEWSIAIFCVCFFGQQSWSTLVMIVPTDLFPRRVVASVAGLVGFGGAMGGLLMNLLAGRLLDAGFGYQTVFSIVGMLHVTAFAVIMLAIPIMKSSDENY